MAEILALQNLDAEHESDYWCGSILFSNNELTR
jgi:hypothetical protein